MIDSRCGLHCTNCSWKESHGCGECSIIPCTMLYNYSYLDPEHGDKPLGARVTTCRKWAAESGKLVWGHVLLTSAGWHKDIDGSVKENIRQRFLNMLCKPVGEVRVLFIPTAAISDEAKKMADKCRDELLNAGIIPENIFVYDIDGSLAADEAMIYDVIYFTGGNTGYLLRRIKDTGFDTTIKKMVYANKVYVGVSAGSILATPNIHNPFDDKTAGLAIINAYISVHQPEYAPARTDLPLPHIPLTDNQALVVNWDGYEIVEN